MRWVALAIAILVAMFGTVRAETPRCGASIGLVSTSERYRTASRDGSVRLRGSGFAAAIAIARPWRSWCLGGFVSGRATGDLVYEAPAIRTPLPEAALLEATLGARASREWSRRWWAGVTLAPVIGAYVSPRVWAVSGVGGVLGLELSRELAMSRRWSLDLGGIGELAYLPDAAQSWLVARVGLNAAVRVVW